MSNSDSSKPPLPEDLESTIARLLDWYGDGDDGASPNAGQWRRVLGAPAGTPVTLINFFKLRGTALYTNGSVEAAEAVSGQEAMMRYAAVSAPALARVGGRFVLMGALEGTLLGHDEDWDAVAIGSYPDRHSLLSLFSDAEYRGAWRHRRAAMARQRVLVAPV